MTQAPLNQFTIRAMTRQDLDRAINWAAAEGWNPGLKDADCFQAADPMGFLVGRLGGEPIASISVVPGRSCRRRPQGSRWACSALLRGSGCTTLYVFDQYPVASLTPVRRGGRSAPGR